MDRRIAPADVKEMVSDTLESDLSAATVRKLVFTLKGILEEAGGREPTGAQPL